MKYLMIFSVLCCFHIAQSQTIHIVNNNPGASLGVNNYATFTEAIDVAVDNDQIYIVPSGTNYGAINITKSITVYGIGIYPDTQTKLTSMVNNVVIRASNVRVSGLIVTTRTGVGIKVQVDVINTTIDKCKFIRFNADETGVANILI